MSIYLVCATGLRFGLSVEVIGRSAYLQRFQERLLGSELKLDAYYSDRCVTALVTILNQEDPCTLNLELLIDDEPQFRGLSLQFGELELLKFYHSQAIPALKEGLDVHMCADLVGMCSQMFCNTKLHELEAQQEIAFTTAGGTVISLPFAAVQKSPYFRLCAEMGGCQVELLPSLPEKGVAAVLQFLKQLDLDGGGNPVVPMYITMHKPEEVLPLAYWQIIEPLGWEDVESLGHLIPIINCQEFNMWLDIRMAFLVKAVSRNDPLLRSEELSRYKHILKPFIDRDVRDGT